VHTSAFLVQMAGQPEVVSCSNAHDDSTLSSTQRRTRGGRWRLNQQLNASVAHTNEGGNTKTSVQTHTHTHTHTTLETPPRRGYHTCIRASDTARESGGLLFGTPGIPRPTPGDDALPLGGPQPLSSPLPLGDPPPLPGPPRIICPLPGPPRII
jgi:hypothetical protein